MGSGGDLLSRAVTSQVPSALKGLTSVFGMGTGVTPSSLPPEMVNYLGNHFRDFFVPLAERWTRSVVLFFLLTGRWIALRNPDNCTAPRFTTVCLFPAIAVTQSLSTLDSCSRGSIRRAKARMLPPIGSRSYLKSSPRPISIIKLHTLPYFHR